MADTEPDDITDVVILSIALNSGRFHSEVRVPLLANSADKESTIYKWLEMMKMAFDVGATRMDAEMEFNKKRG